MAIAVEVQKCRPRAPAWAGEGETALARHIAERAVAVVAIENVMPVVGHEQVVVTVVVVVAGRNALSPSAGAKARLARHINERAVPLVAIEMARRCVVDPGSRPAGAVEQEDVRPIVVVVVDDGEAAPGCFQDVVFGAFSTDDRACAEPDCGRHVTEVREYGVAGRERDSGFGRCAARTVR